MDFSFINNNEAQAPHQPAPKSGILAYTPQQRHDRWLDIVVHPSGFDKKTVYEAAMVSTFKGSPPLTNMPGELVPDFGSHFIWPGFFSIFLLFNYIVRIRIVIIIIIIIIFIIIIIIIIFIIIIIIIYEFYFTY
jgi:hypothetical protein